MAKRDFDRGLNDRGRKGAALIGDHIRDHGVKWEKLLASPAHRVQSTLKAALPEMEAELDEKLYLASAATILDTIVAHSSGEDAILVAGHNPGLQEAVLELVPPRNENTLFETALAKFPTAAFAVLECEIDDWADLPKAKAKLVHFARPRDLDPELGPEY